MDDLRAKKKSSRWREADFSDDELQQYKEDFSKVKVHNTVTRAESQGCLFSGDPLTPNRWNLDSVFKSPLRKQQSDRSKHLNEVRAIFWDSGPEQKHVTVSNIQSFGSVVNIPEPNPESYTSESWIRRPDWYFVSLHITPGNV